jgi:hypothetical protein
MIVLVRHLNIKPNYSRISIIHARHLSSLGFTFQKGSIPVGNSKWYAPRTTHVSTIVKAMETAMESSIIPKRGLLRTNWVKEHLYAQRMLYRRKQVVKTHQGSLKRYQHCLE